MHRHNTPAAALPPQHEPLRATLLRRAQLYRKEKMKLSWCRGSELQVLVRTQQHRPGLRLGAGRRKPGKLSSATIAAPLSFPAFSLPAPRSASLEADGLAAAGREFQLQC